MLAELLRQRIHQNGPLSLYEYMALCLYHPQEGYYMRHIPMGSQGDFITAPEISQMFGELIGAYLLQYGEEHLKDSYINLVECGPGKGRLMLDMLRVFQLRPALKTNIKLLEISPVLKAHQQQALQKHTIQWYTSLKLLLEEAAPHPLLLVANEFLDALPVHQYTYKANSWHQRHVTWKDNALAFCWKPCQQPPCDWPQTETTYEHAPDAANILQEIIQYLKRYGGMAIFIDYGYINSSGDTLQGMQRHKYASVLEHPGQTDLTTHVNFGLLKDLAEAQGCVTSLMTQGAFLSQLGIHLRAQQLTKNTLGETQNKVNHQVDYLTKKMGELFKVLVVQSSA